MGTFEVKECDDTEVVKELFKEYSQIKGAESCFVSFDKELADMRIPISMRFCFPTP